MKNLFLSAVLLLTVSFAFGSSEMKTPIENPEIKNFTIFNQPSSVECLFELTWDTDELGTGSLWIDCGPTDDGPFNWNDFLDTILANFLGIK